MGRSQQNITLNRTHTSLYNLNMGKDKETKHKSKKSKVEEKKRKAESDSDNESSDTSIEEDKEMPSVNKQSTNEAGEPFFSLGENRRVTVREFKGKTFVDVREFYEKDGKHLPGKKGICLSISQYHNLKSAMQTLEKLL